jgi:nitrite reductase (NO-forming)
MPPAIDRRDDRMISAAGIALAGALLAVAAASTFLPPELRRGTWLPIHLGLAGAASVAIAAMLPFFAATLAIARPVDPLIRATGIVLPLLGIVGVAAGLAWGPRGLAEAGGVTYLAGIATVAIATFVPLARSTVPRRGALAATAAAALADVALGAILGTLYASNALWVLERWAALKPAHAWLNILGFVGVVVTSTLVHLWPTVLGARIRAGGSAVVVGAGWALGPPVVAAGFAAGSDAVARLGAVVTLIGVAGLAVFAIREWVGRGRWTTDPAWHLAATGHVGAGIAWGCGGTVVAAALVLAHGASPDAWSAAAVLPAVGLGWIVQTLVGAWTHLVPTIGPGDPAAHAAQRRRLGRWAGGRLVAFEVGVALVAAGLPAGSVAVAGAGVAAAGASLAVSVALLAAALRVR